MESKPNKNLKVFHGLVNYGTQAGLLANELRKQGVDALSVSFPDQFKRKIDVEFLSGGNLIQKIFRHSVNFLNRIFWFFKYNTFHFYYGTTLLPKQIDLYFYKFFNKKVVFHYLGNEIQGYKVSVEKYKWTNMPGFLGDNDPIQYDNKNIARLKRETKFANLQLVCAPLYSEFVPNSSVLPLAINIKEYNYSTPPKNIIPVLMHAPTHRGFKGTEYIFEAVDKLKREGYEFVFKIVENVSHKELKELYIKCDVFIDQITSGWYGTASIEAMALGRPVICSIRSSYFEHIDYGPNIPIIHADPDCIYDAIKYVIINQDLLPEIGLKSRKFVEEIHDSKKITNDLINLYKNL